MKKCSITLIINNRLSFTKMTMHSIIENTKFPYELIVIDNGSNADVINYLISMKKYIDHLILNKNNIGKVNANNFGWRLSRCDYIATVENDVYLESGWLNTCIEYLDKIPMIGLISPTNHDLDRFERGKTKEYMINTYNHNGLKYYVPKSGVVPGTVVAKREIIEKVGLHKTNGCFYEHSCPEFCRRMMEKYYCCAYPDKIIGYHVDIKNVYFDRFAKMFNLDKNDYAIVKKQNEEIKNKIDHNLIYNFLGVK